MIDIFGRTAARLDRNLTLTSRVLVLLALLVVIPTFVVPLWHMTFVAQQYPEGLELYVYSHDLVGGNKGNDLTEINVLNHYIGMAELRPSDFSELKWIPLVIGLIAVMTLRAAAIGNVRAVVDVIVGSMYFGAFSMWTFYSKMNYYGANLDARASVQVEPFMPPIFGYKQVGQFDVWSYPALGSYLFLVFGLLLVGAVFLSYRQQRSDSNAAGGKS
ncbi:MAG: hypothetical protein OEV00_05380 [Acidobacteriota bacterium]|nr:hypothetical protein [Acidobacteriota bacterium]MDH3784746.1 hypothetical protein [Acidobacteriota bacterium]